MFPSAWRCPRGRTGGISSARERFGEQELRIGRARTWNSHGSLADHSTIADWLLFSASDSLRGFINQTLSESPSFCLPDGGSGRTLMSREPVPEAWKPTRCNHHSNVSCVTGLLVQVRVSPEVWLLKACGGFWPHVLRLAPSWCVWERNAGNFGGSRALLECFSQISHAVMLMRKDFSPRRTGLAIVIA